MGRRGEDEGEGSGPRFEDARIVKEPSRRMTAAAVTLSRGCAERIRDGIGASTSEASASETRRARREFADGGSATGTSSLRDDSGFVSLTYTPRKPTATFLRASALDRARVEFGPSIYSGGFSAPGDDADGSGAARDGAPSRDHPTNDASPRLGNPGACGDDGGVVIDATVNRRRSVHQLSFLSNLAERRRWDDASIATKWTLLEPGKKSRPRANKKTDSPRRWWSFLRPGYLRTGHSPEVSAVALLHWDSFGDATAEVEIKKQAQTHGLTTAPGQPGNVAFLRGSRLARVTAVSEAFVTNLRGPNGPTSPRVEVNVAGEVGAPGDPTAPPVYVRGKLTSDLANAGAHWLAAEVRAGEGSASASASANGKGKGNGNGAPAMLAHLRFFTDFKRSHALRLRHASRSRESAPAPGAPSWGCAVAQTLTTPAVGSGFRGLGFNYESKVEVAVRCARSGESPDGESPGGESPGGELRFDAKVARDGVGAGRAAIRASSSAPRASSSSDAVDTRSVEFAVSGARGVEGVGFEWRREWRAARDVVRGDRVDDDDDDGGDTAVGGVGGDGVEPRRFASIRVTAVDPRGGGPSAFCEFNSLGTLRDDLVFGRRDDKHAYDNAR